MHSLAAQWRYEPVEAAYPACHQAGRACRQAAYPACRQADPACHQVDPAYRQADRASQVGHLWGAPTTSRRSSDSSSTRHRHHQVSSPNPVAVDRHCLQAVADRRPTAELCSCRSSLLLSAGVRPARLHPPCLASYRCFPQCCGCSSTSRPLHPWRKTILRAGHRTSPCSRSETDCFLLDGCPLPSVRSAAPARVWRNRASVTQGRAPQKAADTSVVGPLPSALCQWPYLYLSLIHI